MDTASITPAIAKVFLIALFLSSPFAGFFLCLSAAKAGRGWILTIIFFVVGIVIYLGFVYSLITYIMAFHEHVFMAQFISLGIVAVISYIFYTYWK